jgi:CBS domain-containing protein
LRVKDIMDPKHPTIYQDELATKARAIIRDYNIRLLPVTDDNKRLLGKVSRRDIMTITSSVSPIIVKGIMTPPKHIATVEDDVASAFKAMVKVDVWEAPVVTSAQDKTYRGVVGLDSFIEHLLKTSPEKFLKEVSEVMTKNLVTCSPDDEVDDIWRLMQKTRFTGLPVVRDGKLVGIVTQKDLLERGAMLPAFESTKGRFRASPKVSSIMKTNVVAVVPTTKIIKVARVMVSKDIGRVPVRDKDGRLIGMVDREDIARAVTR